MFCSNCGAEVVNEARFCASCGCNLESTTKQVLNNNKVLQRETSAANDETISVERIVETSFRKVFNLPRVYGDQIFIIGKDPINKTMDENISNYYLDGNEKPLLAFNYEKNMKEGFVITNRRIVWNFGSTGTGESSLTNIKEVTVNRVILARVMRLISYDNIQSANIYLTGIRKDTEFVSKFEELIKEIEMYYK